MKVNGCFLCEPDPALVYVREPAGLALCGLGPVVDGYSVVATKDHIRSAADTLIEEIDFLDLVARVREVLIQRYGSCLITEHGRMPVCADLVGAERHCYHAHFLMFPNAPPVEEAARTYFEEIVEASSMRDALKLVHGHEEYFFLSPTPERSMVMFRAGRMVRQFARALVSGAVGKPERADWRRFPEDPTIVEEALALRGRFRQDDRL